MSHNIEFGHANFPREKRRKKLKPFLVKQKNYGCKALIESMQIEKYLIILKFFQLIQIKMIHFMNQLVPLYLWPIFLQ